MAENSKIEWTDHTFNPWIGCSKVHEGCRHCYAERDFDLRRGKAKWGVKGTRVVTSDANWAKPYRWNKAAEQCGVRAKVFCASLADVFEDWQGPMVAHDGCTLWICPGCKDEIDGALPAVQMSAPHCLNCNEPYYPMTMGDVRGRLFDMIDATPWLDWLLLTKRPENVVRMWVPRGSPHVGAQLAPDVVNPNRRQNVWLLTSISDQQTADKQIPELLQCRDLCPVLGVSAEPLLGPIDLRQVKRPDGWVIDALTGEHSRQYDETVDEPGGIECHEGGPRIDWVIAGGESGPHARPMHPDWARSLRDQCHAAGVPFFFKQWGEFFPRCTPARFEDATVPPVPYRPGCPDPYPWAWMDRVGKHAAGRVLDGQTWDEMPSGSFPSPAAK